MHSGHGLGRRSIGLSVIVTLGRLVFAHQAGIVYSYVCTWLDAYVCGISRRNSFKGGECETSENPDFSKEG